MRLFLVSIVLVLSLVNRGVSCDCKFGDLRTELHLSKEIVAGRLVEVDEDGFKIKVLKTWKGQIKTESLTITIGGGCYRRILFPANEHFIIFLESDGIHICSRTTKYLKSQDIKMLDSIFGQTLWINENEMMTLAKLEHKRKYLIQTDKGEINIKDKNVIYNFEGKVTSRENLPADLNDFYPIRYFLVATKESIRDNPCDIDYILYINQVHQDMILLETRRKKIEKKSMRRACR